MKSNDNIIIEKHKDFYIVSYLTKNLNVRRYIVPFKNVSLFSKIIISLRLRSSDNNFLVSKNIVHSYLYQHIFSTARYTISDEYNSSDLDMQYSAAFQGGINKKYYYDYYILPIKILEFYNLISLDKNNIYFKVKELEKFYSRL